MMGMKNRIKVLFCLASQLLNIAKTFKYLKFYLLKSAKEQSTDFGSQ